MRDDNANGPHMQMIHSHQAESNAAREDAKLAAEFGPEHEALIALADAWNARMPSAEQLVNFARQLPAQERAARGAMLTETLPERLHRARRDAMPTPATYHLGAGRLLLGLMVAIVVFALLAATLLRFAPSRTAQRRQTPPAVAASATPQTVRSAEEPTREPPAGVWATVTHAQLIPAPSDGNVVYQTDGAVARVSHDGGASWRDLAIPTFTQKVVLSGTVTLRVSDADSQVILLSMILTVSSAVPADCPPGSKAPAPDNLSGMHGGVLASGASYCIANFASHDGGDTWSAMSMPADVTYPPSALNPARVWQLGRTLYGLNAIAAGPPLYGSSLLVSHDLGTTWAYRDSTSPEASANLCSFLPSAGDGALYALTSAQNCLEGLAIVSAYTLWRSVDGGATWSRVSSLATTYTELVAASPALGGHGVWIYAQRLESSRSTTWVSLDQGATWSQTPDLPQVNNGSVTEAINGALADGSMVVASIEQRSGSANLSSSPVPASFYAWRPGDIAWRPLSTTLTANYAFHSDGSQPITLSRGGAYALDTLWVIEANGDTYPQLYSTHRYGIA